MDSTIINRTAFYGKTRFLSCNSEGKAKRISDCPYGTAYFGETRGLSDFVKKHSYPGANIEETIGKTHDKQTYRIYIADPKEKVSDTIKQNHDYIVYDVEPAFPDTKAYLGTDNELIAKNLKIANEYYKRLESAGINIGDADTVNLSKNRQNIVTICSKMFSEGDDLRKKRLSLENKVHNKTFLINETEANIPKYKKELTAKRRYLEKNKKTLEIKEESLRSLKAQRLLLKDITDKTPTKINSLKSDIERYEFIISGIKNRIQKYQDRINFLEDYIEKAQTRISNWKQEIAGAKKQINDIKRALIPNFKKLQEFYTINGIKIIKHI